ncbi:MerR family transcriptional regulator [Vagococcus fluvialis]|uniref:MerR family transcriptional regulator n=1 Tax=Vagococcus fluvialis TaxID=2738 RepID=UPI001A8CC79A|nr:MerR family transcriptional regulator [Vagococcus fluvialis]MBO0428437.1 MerR family transcriptional regulator [Vagococcus fluvialis]
MTKLLTTGQLASLFKLPKHTIRHYIDEELLTPIINEDNGYQQFTERDIYKLYQVIVLRKIGFSIEMIKEMIKKDTILPSLETAVDDLEDQINELRAVQKTVSHILEANQEVGFNELTFVEKEKRYLKKVPSELLKDNSIDLLSAHKLGFEHLDIFYYITDNLGEESIYTLGSKENFDKVLEKRVYATKDIELESEEDLVNEASLMLEDPLFEMSSRKEIICYENIYRSLGFRDKSFFTVEIAL